MFIWKQKLIKYPMDRTDKRHHTGAEEKAQSNSIEKDHFVLETRLRNLY